MPGALGVTGAACVLFSLAALLVERSAMGVVLDLRAPGLLAAAAGVVLLAARLALRRARRRDGAAPGHPARRAAAAALPLLAVATLALHVRSSHLIHRQEDVAFRNGDVELRGSLYVPRRPGERMPGVVVLHGSGRVTRDEPAFYARLFARHGFAALAYDKRGSGASGGDLYRSRYEDLARDAGAAIALLRKHPGVDPRRVGLLGFSEAEWVGALAAAADPEVAFLAVVSPSGRTPAEQVAWELEATLRAEGFDAAAIERAVALNHRLFEYQRRGTDADSLRRDLAAARSEPWFGPAELPDELYSMDDYAWWRSVMDFDPLPHWRRVACPVLLVSGGLDTKSPVRDSQERIRRALLEGGNTHFTGRVFDRAGHGLVEWWLPAGLPPPRFPEGYPALVVEWAREQVAPSG